MPTHGADLVATFNRIPLGRKPFVISFESHLPRLFNYENTPAFRYFTSQLASERCKKIIPISKFARNIFLKMHRDSEMLPELTKRLAPPIYPSVNVPQHLPEERQADGMINVFFVGAHFSRKGGAALLLAAKYLHEKRAPVRFHIVSSLTVGGINGVWTDPKDPAFFDRYKPLLSLPNIELHGRMRNDDLLKLMRRCDISILPTLCDTFGYSILESFSSGIPVIATNISAIPELVEEGNNGFLLDIEKNDIGEWRHLFTMDQSSDEYLNIFSSTMDDISIKIIECLLMLAENRLKMKEMKINAFMTAKNRFEAHQNSKYLDVLYEQAIQ